MVRVDIVKFRIKTRLAKVRLENIKVKTRPVQVKLRNQGIALKGVEILLRKEKVQMRNVVVGVGNIGAESGNAALEENQPVVDEEQHLEDLNDVTSELVSKKDIPPWARTVNYMAEAKSQEETGSDATFSIFAPVNQNLEVLEESDIFRIPAKTPKRSRLGLELDLSSYNFDPADLLAETEDEPMDRAAGGGGGGGHVGDPSNDIGERTILLNSLCNISRFMEEAEPSGVERRSGVDAIVVKCWGDVYLTGIGLFGSSIPERGLSIHLRIFCNANLLWEKSAQDWVVNQWGTIDVEPPLKLGSRWRHLIVARVAGAPCSHHHHHHHRCPLLASTASPSTSSPPSSSQVPPVGKGDGAVPYTPCPAPGVEPTSWASTTRRRRCWKPPSLMTRCTRQMIVVKLNKSGLNVIQVSLYIYFALRDYNL